MITKAGAKLLDFGLAKPRQPGAFAGSTETITDRGLTRAGTIVGIAIHGSGAVGGFGLMRSEHLRVWHRPLRDAHRPRPAPGEDSSRYRRRHHAGAGAFTTS